MKFQKIFQSHFELPDIYAVKCPTMTCWKIPELKWSLQVCNRRISWCTHMNIHAHTHTHVQIPFLTVPMMILYTYNYLVCHLCPSSCILQRPNDPNFR